MAEPGGAVEVHGAITAVDGAVAKEDPDLLLAQIDACQALIQAAGRVAGSS